MRAYKTVNDSYIEPISFIVPRRAEVFQHDIYPPTTGTKPAMSAADWFSGKEGLPPKIDLESVYAGEEPTEVASDSKPPVTQPRAPSPQAPPPAKKEPEPPKEPATSAGASRGPPPSMKEQQGSIAAMASKFADDDASEEEGTDSSSFEDIAEHINRTERAAPVDARAAGKANLPPLAKAVEHDHPTTQKSGHQATAEISQMPAPETKRETAPTQVQVSNAV